MAALGWQHNDAVYQSLDNAYAEGHRHYHNKSHIKATLGHLDEVKAMADYPLEIELALWFHDAIYRPFSSTNERDSANWACIFMTQNQASDDMISRVKELIMATCHNAPTSTIDQSLMVDVDLSILGASSDLYASYERWIRLEYRWVPGFIYRRKRKALLGYFLAQKPIFKTTHFQQKFEAQAIKNLTWALQQI